MSGSRPGGALFLGLLGSFVNFVATLVGAALMVQLLLWAAPGDAADLVANDPELRAELVRQWGLDRPAGERLVSWLADASQGELGSSLTYRPGEPVAALVKKAVGQSTPLLLSSLLLTLGLGVALAYGRLSERPLGRALMRAVSVTPAFLLAWWLMITLNEGSFSLMEAGRIARPSWFALPDEDSLLKTSLGVFVLAIGSASLIEVHAACAAELAAIRGSAYVDAARARGAPLWPHVLLNLVPPLTTITSTRAAYFVGGLVVVEKVLHLNGAGAMLWQACRMRDYPLALGLTLAAAATVCAARLFADMTRLLVDPRRGARR